MQFVWSYQIFCLLFYIAVFISRNQFGTDRSVYNIEQGNCLLYTSYAVHPDHVAAAGLLKEVKADRACVDYEF